MISLTIDFLQLLWEIMKELVFVLGALLTPTVAFFAGIIAYKQLGINNKVYSIGSKQLDIEQMTYKMNLFDKRYKIYEAIKALLFEITANLEFPNDLFYKNFSRIIDSHIFIFNDDINKYITDLKEKSKRLNMLNKKYKMSEFEEKGPDFKRQMEIREELIKWFHLQESEVEEKFVKYLKLS